MDDVLTGHIRVIVVILRLTGWMAVLCLIGLGLALAALPGAVGYFLPEAESIGTSQRIALILIGIVNLVPGALAAHALARLAGACLDGYVFPDRAIRWLPQMGWSLIAAGFLSILIGPLIDIVLAFGADSGSVSIQVSSGHIAALAAGGLLIVQGRVMAQAARIAEENGQFI